MKEYEVGESDKRLLLLCKERGRVLIRARGARKPRSKFMAAAQIFTYSDFVLAEGRGFVSLAQADVIENFYDLRTDYDRLCAAYEIVDVCEKTVHENENCDDLLLLVLKSLSNLSRGKFQPRQIFAVFMLRFFDVSGLRPHTDECAVCKKIVAREIFWGGEGVLCAAHGGGSVKNEREERGRRIFDGDLCVQRMAKNVKNQQEERARRMDKSLPLSAAAAAAISYVLKSDLPRSFKFETTDDVLEELNDAVKLLWNFHFGA